MSGRRAVAALLWLPVLMAGCRHDEASSPKEKVAEERKRQDEKEHGEAMPSEVNLTQAAIDESGIQTWRVQPVDLAHMLLLNGSVEHNDNKLLHVASHVKGRVVEIPADLGARIEKGAPLVVLESIELARAREEFYKARSELDVSQRAYERAQALVDAKAISKGELQAREGDYLSKRATLEAARRALHLLGEHHELADLPDTPPTLVVRAPFAGRVIERKVTPGTLVDALQPLVTLADISSVWVYLNAYEKDLALLETGLRISLETDAYPQQAFTGTLDFIGSVVDPATRTIKMRATVRNPEEKLRPGMFVKARVNVPKPESEAKRILAVPQAALQTLEGRMVLFVETEPGTFTRHFVETGHTFEGFTEILSGIKSDDVIVTEGSFVLKSEFAKATLSEAD